VSPSLSLVAVCTKICSGQARVKHGQLKSFAPILHQRLCGNLCVCVCFVLLHRLQRAADKGEAIDLQEVFYRYTLDSFAEVAFGVKLDSQNKVQSACLDVPRLWSMCWYATGVFCALHGSGLL
jgi:hypothetical protein